MKHKLILKGKTAVFIDWANVHGWESKFHYTIDPKKLYTYLKTYKNITTINFYFGTDTHPKSKSFLQATKKIGYSVTTKDVKYITVNQKPFIQKRKCDFDIEICMFTLLKLDMYTSYIFFSGDGDFAPLYSYLISKNKQVIVVSTKWSLGKEVAQITKGIYIVNVTVFKSIYS